MSREHSAATAPPSGKWNIALWGLWLALFVAAISRGTAVLTHPWVLNDGGLFLAMAHAIEANGWKLPATVFYPIAGYDTLPFCYPPLGFYLAVVSHKLGVPLETYFRFAPAVWNLGAVWGFWRLARVLFSDDRIVAGATLAFTFLPMSMNWNLMGGGVTRGVAFTLTLFFLEQIARLWAAPESASKFNLAWAALLLGAVLACHLERFHFCVLSMALFWVAFRPHWRSAAQAAFIVVGSVVLSSPWWAVCLARYGFEPFLAAASSGNSAWTRGVITPFALFSEPLLPLISCFGVIGTLLLLKRKCWVFLAWMVLIVVFEARSYRTFFVIPISMAAGSAVAACWPRPDGHWKMAREFTLGLTMIWGLVCSTGTAALMRSLTAHELAGMDWVRSHSRPEDNFLVLPVNQWASDLPAEWFPALAARRSISTVQGSEWLPGEFAKRRNRHDEIWALRTWPGIQEWLRAGQLKADYIWVPRQGVDGPSYEKVVEGLARDPGVRLVLQNPAVALYQLKP